MPRDDYLTGYLKLARTLAGRERDAMLVYLIEMAILEAQRRPGPGARRPARKQRGGKSTRAPEA